MHLFLSNVSKCDNLYIHKKGGFHVVTALLNVTGMIIYLNLKKNNFFPEYILLTY